MIIVNLYYAFSIEFKLKYLIFDDLIEEYKKFSKYFLNFFIIKYFEKQKEYTISAQILDTVKGKIWNTNADINIVKEYPALGQNCLGPFNNRS